MNAKKIIRGVMGLGTIAGVAYLAFKLGESNGEIIERFREKYGDDEDDNGITDDDDDDEYRFYDNMDEPDDGCIAPAPHEDYWLYEYDKFLTEGYDENCDNGDHFFTRLRNIDSEGIPMNGLFKSVFFITKYSRISNKKLRDELDVSFDEAEHILNVLETAGYVSVRDDRYSRKVYIRNMTLEDLL